MILFPIAEPFSKGKQTPIWLSEKRSTLWYLDSTLYLEHWYKPGRDVPITIHSKMVVLLLPDYWYCLRQMSLSWVLRQRVGFDWASGKNAGLFQYIVQQSLGGGCSWGHWRPHHGSSGQKIVHWRKRSHPLPGRLYHRINGEWAVSQIESTVNWKPKSAPHQHWWKFYLCALLE